MRRVREIREARGLSQTKLAEMTGLTQATLSNLESGKHDPHLETLRMLARALGVPPAALLEEDDPKEVALEATPEERLRASLRALLASEQRSLFLAGVALDSGLWVAGTTQADLVWLKSFAAQHEVEPQQVLEAMYELWPELRALQRKYAAQAQRVSEEVEAALKRGARTA